MNFHNILHFFQRLIIKEYFPHFYTIENLLDLQLEEIDSVKIDCFHRHDLGRFYSFKTYSQKDEHIANLIKSIVNNSELKNVQFDLRKLTNATASKSLSWGYSYDSMYLFGRNLVNVVDMVNQYGDKSFSTIESCLQDMRYNDEFIFRIDHVLWENRYVWINDGGSHHCATAIFYAENQHKELLVNTSFCIQSLNKNAIKEINDKYKIFVISSKRYSKLQNNLSSYHPIYLEPLQSQNMLLIFEKDNNQVPDIIMRFLETYDQRYILDFNRYISNLLEKQLKNEEEEHE